VITWEDAKPFIAQGRIRKVHGPSPLVISLEDHSALTIKDGPVDAIHYIWSHAPNGKSIEVTLDID